jgi:hypothetical protein
VPQVSLTNVGEIAAVGLRGAGSRCCWLIRAAVSGTIVVVSSSLEPVHLRAVGHVAAAAADAPVDRTLRVTVHFHPDRADGGVPILVSMRLAGTYQSQFVTGTGNGGLTAHSGGDRWLWESRMFGGAYDDAPPDHRPIYGALNYRRRSVGGSPRFGSAHCRLSGDVLPRTTFCYPDSCYEPSSFAVADRFGLLELVERDAEGRDRLDDYVEAQVHGPVRFDEHVEALVLDPCFRGTETEAQARLLGCPVEWHEGFRLGVDVLREHPDYRGQEYVDLGADLAVDGMLTPRILGDAARSGQYDAQALKRVWHYLARFGALAADE